MKERDSRNKQCNSSTPVFAVQTILVASTDQPRCRRFLVCSLACLRGACHTSTCTRAVK